MLHSHTNAHISIVMSGDDGYVQPMRAKIVAEQRSKCQKSLPGHDIDTKQQIDALYNLFNKQTSPEHVSALGKNKINEAYEHMMDITRYMDLGDGITPWLSCFKPVSVLLL